MKFNASGDKTWNFRGIIIVFSLLVILVIGIYGLGDALLPLCFSFCLAYLMFPVIKKMESKGFGRNKAVITVFALVLIVASTLMALVIPGLVSDSVEFSKELPSIAMQATEKVETLASNLGIQLDLSKNNIQDYMEGHRSELMGSISGKATLWVKSIFSGAVKWLISILNIFLIPLFFFYLINDFEKITNEIKSFIPKPIIPKLKHYMLLSNTVLSGYIRGQIMVALILGCLYGIGLFAIDLKFGFLIGMVSGLISIIPYAGLTIGFATALMVGLANFTGMGTIIGIVIVFAIVQALEGILITPKLVGDKVGLGSLSTMLALIIGGNLFGMAGMILGIPVTAIIKSLLIDLKKEYQQLGIYQ